MPYDGNFSAVGGFSFFGGNDFGGGGNFTAGILPTITPRIHGRRGPLKRSTD